ncbi:hypothetical protein Tco_1023006 [Tanacetum coccineum]
MDTNRLHVYVFPFSLTGVAQTWWIIEGTRDDKDEGDDYLEFIIWLNSKCKDHKSIDGTTKSALWYYWLNEEGNNELMDDTESSDKELKKSDQGNPHNTDTDSFFKPYLDAWYETDIQEKKKNKAKKDKTEHENEKSAKKQSKSKSQQRSQP